MSTVGDLLYPQFVYNHPDEGFQHGSMLHMHESSVDSVLVFNSHISRNNTFVNVISHNNVSIRGNEDHLQAHSQRLAIHAMARHGLHPFFSLCVLQLYATRKHPACSISYTPTKIMNKSISNYIYRHMYRHKIQLTRFDACPA